MKLPAADELIEYNPARDGPNPKETRRLAQME
jgi:hypothetical protein